MTNQKRPSFENLEKAEKFLNTLKHYKHFKNTDNQLCSAPTGKLIGFKDSYYCCDECGFSLSTGADIVKLLAMFLESQL